MERINYKELIELFVTVTIPYFIRREEGFRVNFVFEKDAFDYFSYVKENPFVLENFWTPDIHDEDIEKILDVDFDYPTIFVNNYKTFFNLLYEIINSNLELYELYGDRRSARSFTMNLLSRIWLRMGADDFNNVESFLRNQLEMIKDRKMDFISENIITDYQDYMVLAKTKVNPTWDETVRSIDFSLTDGKNIHHLPKINFGINGDTCYIYAVQGVLEEKRNKKIERSIYKLKSKFPNEDIHPNFILSMLLFIRLLKQRNIYKIKVPILQELSYDYHVYISELEKVKFEKKWTKEAFERLSLLGEFTRNAKLEEYKYDLIWYNNVVDKYDLISKIKTEKLIELMNALEENIDNFRIINDIDIQGNSLEIRLKKTI